MLTQPVRNEAPTRDFPEMSNEDLNRAWSEARDIFDLALAEKTEADRIYVAAATRLNTLDRLVKKVAQRAAVKLLLRKG